MTHRATGEDRLRRDSEEPNYREPPLIGMTAPWRCQADQAPEPESQTTQPGAAFVQLAEALRPYGFRWPYERQTSQPAGQLSAESLFLQARQSQIAYLNWKTGTQPNLRLMRLFLLMRSGWSNTAIQEAIREPALASWWLSGEATAWGVDPTTQKASRALVSFLQTKPEQIEAAWRHRLQAEKGRHSAPQPNPEPTKPPRLSSKEVAATLQPEDKPAFSKALWRAAKAFRQKGRRKPEPLGGAGEGWALAELGAGGHGRGHQLVKARAE